MHIRNAYNEGELEKESTCKEYLQVQTEGKRRVKRIQKYYDLDVIPHRGKICPKSGARLCTLGRSMT